MIKNSPGEPARHLDVAALALTFEEIAVDIVRGESTEFLSRWFRASKGEADLTIWWDSESRVVKQQLCVFGQVVEWNPIHGTRTGLVIEHEAAPAPGASRSEVPGAATPHEPADAFSDNDATSEIIRFDAKTQASSVALAITLIESLTALKGPDRALLSYNFRESPKLHKNARERAIKAWAPQGEELLESSSRSGFWKSVTGWFFGK